MRQRRGIRTTPWPLLALLVAAAACGGGGGGGAGGGSDGVASAGGAAGAGTEAPVDDLASWAQCMRDQGADVPDPDPYGKLTDFELPPRGSPEAELHAAAEEVCGLIDAVSGGDTDEPMSSADVEQWTEWAQCMRDNGVDIDDPDPSVNQPPTPNEGTDAYVFRAAEEACAEHAPGSNEDRSLP